MRDFLICEISRKEFEDLMIKLDQILENQNRESVNGLDQEYLTRKEVCEILKISLTTLHDWTKKGRIKGYKIGGLIRYRRNDIDNSMEELKYMKRN